jgi:glycosyltransferase involved in cell wall biosynthesis
MIIEVIATFYNDEFLAPFFFRHYAWATRIRAMIDSATTDRTMEIAREYYNVIPQLFSFPQGMDDILKRENINRWYRESSADWVIMVDADEFLFAPTAIRVILAETNMSDVVCAKLFQVYRHRSDKDLDPDIPVIIQRRHGDPNTSTGSNREFNKPCIVRTGKDIEFHVGNHYIDIMSPPFTIGGNIVYGAHWCNADPCFCVDRRLRAMKRQGERNLAMGLSIQHHNITRESVIEECNRHLDDPQLF